MIYIGGATTVSPAANSAKRPQANTRTASRISSITWRSGSKRASSAVTAIEPDDDGTHMDASVEVELSDGSTCRRAAREAPQAIFFHDRKTASELFERRTRMCGCRAGEGASIAAAVVAAAQGDGGATVRAIVDQVTALEPA